MIQKSRVIRRGETADKVRHLMKAIRVMTRKVVVSPITYENLTPEIARLVVEVTPLLAGRPIEEIPESLSDHLIRRALSPRSRRLSTRALFEGLWVDEREVIKKRGWDLIEQPETRLAGVLRLAMGHFHRSAQSAGILRCAHPDFIGYLAAYCRDNRIGGMGAWWPAFRSQLAAALPPPEFQLDASELTMGSRRPLTSRPSYR